MTGALPFCLYCFTAASAKMLGRLLIPDISGQLLVSEIARTVW
jgi:hypothetical protein